MTSSLQTQEKGKFPTQAQPNPSMQCQVSSSNESPIKNVNSVSTLRSGKVIDKTIHSKEKNPSSSGEDDGIEKDSDVTKLVLDPCENKSSKSKERVEPTSINENTNHPIPAPFPQRLQSSKLNQNSEIFEVFKQVKINIPLLDAIKQVPSYAKFLKDLCTVKRKHHVQKKAFLTESVSSIIQQLAPPKYRDPGCPTISCIIGSTRIERALLDLGASVNLLPFSVYEQLGLGELKPIPVVL